MTRTERRILAEAGYEVANTFDSLRVSRQIGPPRSSHRLAAVCERHIGRTLDKSSQSSDWSVRPLSKAQLDYAAIDAEVHLELHDVLVKRVERERNLFCPRRQTGAAGTVEE